MSTGVILISDNDPLSQAFAGQCGDAFTILRHNKDFDAADPESILSRLTGIKPGLVINTVDAIDIDTAECAREAAYDIYAFSVKSLAEWCDREGSLLVQISTSSVFNGEGGGAFTEESAPSPISAYGDAKLLGEHFIRETTDNYLIIRVPDVYGGDRSPFRLPFVRRESENEFIVTEGNFVSPASSAECAESVRTLVEKGARGIFHVGQEGWTSAREFIEKGISTVKSLTDDSREYRVRAVDFREMMTPGDRPLFNVLNLSRFSSFTGVSPKQWDAALDSYIHDNGNGNGLL